MNVLATILERKRAEIADLRRRGPRPDRPSALAPRDVLAALARPAAAPLRLIAEIKHRSPSAGPLSAALPPADRARAYETAGASMVSVLTDTQFFGGSFEHLERARAAVSIPVLCKDFVIDPAQVDRAWQSGADAVLLIVRCLPSGMLLSELSSHARGLGLEPFVEVVDEPELERALDAGARVIGVNARDLDALRMDPERAARVLSVIPKGVVAVHLSGLRQPVDAERIARSRADAALIGEMLMRQDDPGPVLRSLVQAARVEA